MVTDHKFIIRTFFHRAVSISPENNWLGNWRLIDKTRYLSWHVMKFVATHFVSTQFVTTHFVYTQFVATHFIDRSCMKLE